MTAAGIILAGGAQQIGAVFWAALAVAVLSLFAGVFFVLLFKGIAHWRERRGEDTQPMREIDDTIAEFGHDLEKEIEQMQKGWDRG